MKKFLNANDFPNPNNIYIKKIKIKNLYGNRDIEWQLNSSTNILIGKNGSGKSTILKLIDAKINKKFDIFQNFGLEYKDVDIDFIKEDKDDSDRVETKNSFKITTTLINTFDTTYNSVSDCKESCDNELSLLDSQLLKLKNQFSEYQLKFKNKFEEENLANRKEIDRILTDIENGNIEEASKIQALRIDEREIRESIYKKLNIFKEIIDSMFVDTDKKINLDSTQKASSILSRDKELDMLELSSGEKQILIIFLTILLKEDEPYILMMDEPENSLHSEWQIHFVENIRKLNENIQIIIATHNPLLMLNREGDEIGKISINDKIIDTNGEGTKYLDVSATLLSYPKVSSLVGRGMKEDIEEYTKLKFKEEILTSNEQDRVNHLKNILDKTIASNFLYNHKYFQFLQFINKHKEINFNKYKTITEEDMKQLLEDFGDYFND